MYLTLFVFSPVLVCATRGQSAYVYGFDENPVSCEPQVRKLFGATKKAFPTLKTAAVLNWSPMPVDLPVDIWVMMTFA